MLKGKVTTEVHKATKIKIPELIAWYQGKIDTDPIFKMSAAERKSKPAVTQ